MAYGELKVDSITFTNGGSDTTVSVSGLVQNPTFSGDITVTGTISGNIIQGSTTVSGATVTGDTGSFGVVTATTFTGDLSGNATTATSATLATTATNVTVTANNSTNETVYPLFVDGATGSQGAETDTALSYNPSTNVLTAGSFSGSGDSLTSLNANNISAGTLAIARGGTNGSATPTNGGVAYGNGSSYAFTSAGTSGQVLTSNGASAPSWQSAGASLEGETDTTSPFNTYLGYQAGNGTAAADSCVAVGYQSLYTNSNGDDNTAVGYRALFYNTTPSRNTANGALALFSNSTGHSHTAIGYQALTSNTTGYQNSAVGYNAMEDNTTGANNTACGYGALRNNTTASLNVANGSLALQANTTGANNTACGYGALYSNTTAGNNTANGYQALYSNTTGAGNVCIGSLNSSGTYAPVFNCTTENDRVVMSSTSVTNAYIQVAWTVVSDARDKMNFNVVPHGLEFVKQLNPVAFQFKETRDSNTPHGPVRYGFKAQDILALEGEDNAVIIDNENPDKLRYNGEALVPVLVNAIKEQQTLIEAQQQQINDLIARLDAAGI